MPSLKDLSEIQAKEALNTVKQASDAIIKAQRAVQAIVLATAIDNEVRPLHALENITRAHTAILSLEIELRAMTGSGQYPSPGPMTVHQETTGKRRKPT